jgi:hypothetical protein
MTSAHQRIAQGEEASHSLDSGAPTGSYSLASGTGRFQDDSRGTSTLTIDALAYGSASSRISGWVPAVRQVDGRHRK